MKRPTEKYCTGCGRMLPFSAFYYYEDKGYSSRCKECTRAAYAKRARKKGIPPCKGTKRRWSLEDELFLEKNYRFIKYDRLGEILQRTRVAIVQKIGKMGLRKNKKYTTNH